MADISTTIPNLANQTKIANALIKIADKYEKICDIIYPVGSIYITVNNVNPDTLFGGKWEQIEGKFLLAASSDYGAGEEGGEAEHTLTQSELPKITGDIWNVAVQDSGITNLGASGVFSPLKRNEGHGAGTYVSNNGYDGFSMSFGDNKPHNNMPPYIVVYIWKRTA